MLRPDEHTLLTSAIRPPAGYALDQAVGTTFTLDLVALMLTQLTFATHDMGRDLDRVAPIALLDAVTRNADKTTIFVHGGGIGVPGKWRPLLAMLEDSIVEVTPPNGGVFHPKFWALRYSDSGGRFHHRVIVLSRNLTFDQSWDTALILDEAAPNTTAPTIGGADFADFLMVMPDMANRPPQRPGISDLARTLAEATFALPPPYTEARVWPVGAGATFEPGWNGWDGLLIAPFLTRGVVNDIASSVGTLTVVSTAPSLDRLGDPPPNTRLFTLNGTVDPEPEPADGLTDDGAPAPEAEGPAEGGRGPLRGLHAKVFVIDDRTESRTFTGSANATGAAFTTNVELNVELRGAKRRKNQATGIDAIWRNNPEDREDLGLESLVVEYTPQPVEADDERREHLAWALTNYHNRLAGLGLTTTVTPEGEETYVLTVAVPDHDTSCDGYDIRTTLRPLTLPREQALAPALRWEQASLAAVTPYLVATSTASDGTTKVTASCVITSDLIGDVAERRDRVLRDILADANIIAYLAFLLASPADQNGTLSAELLDRLTTGADPARAGGDPPIVLFEPLIHAALGDTEALDRVASVMTELERLDELNNLPDGLLELWGVVVAATEAAGRRGGR